MLDFLNFIVYDISYHILGCIVTESMQQNISTNGIYHFSPIWCLYIASTMHVGRTMQVGRHSITCCFKTPPNLGRLLSSRDAGWIVLSLAIVTFGESLSAQIHTQIMEPREKQKSGLLSVNHKCLKKLRSDELLHLDHSTTSVKRSRGWDMWISLSS